VSDKARVCCGANNRGVAILGDTVFMGTLDAHLVAVDAKNGHPIWNTTVGDVDKAYSITMAPLVVKDKVLVGVGGGEFGIRGFVAAYDAKTGKEAWRFYTIPAPGEPGHDSWSADDWEHGGAPAWITGSRSATQLMCIGGSVQYVPTHRNTEMVFPVHTERRIRLRLGAGARPRRYQLARTERQGHDVGEPQRLFLHP
jgi:hypothetical protein